MPSNRQISLRNRRIIALRRTGMTMSHIAADMGCTKNVVVGVVNRHGNAATQAVTLAGRNRHLIKPVRTMEGRLRALHDKLDRVLALCAPRPEHFVPAPKLQLPRGAR